MDYNKPRRTGRTRGGKRQAAKRQTRIAWQSPKRIEVHAVKDDVAHIICTIDTGIIDLNEAQAYAIETVWTERLTAEGFTPVAKWQRAVTPALSVY